MFDIVKDTLTFVMNYNHINYCEVIISPEGEIIEASPSHQKALIRVSGMTEEEAWEAIPVYASPNNWLMTYAKYVSVYYDFQLHTVPITDQQQYVLNELAKHKKIKYNLQQSPQI